MFLSTPNFYWHYKAWQRMTAGYLRSWSRNNLPNNELVGYVINDKHLKSVRVACDRFMYVVRYKKTFRMTKKVWAHCENNDARLGDVVRLQPMGVRVGPWKTHQVTKIVFKEHRDPVEFPRGTPEALARLGPTTIADKL